MKFSGVFSKAGLVAGMLSCSMVLAETVVLEEFREGEVALRWQIVNDSVMGGVSNSRLDRIDDETVRFSGRLRMENNGGFASMRSAGNVPNISKTNSIMLRVKGDGRRYQMRLRTGDGWRTPDYSAEFTTELGEWKTITLPIDQFVAGWRGRTIRDAPPIDPTNIQSVGILLGDKKPGGFLLEIDWIKAVALEDA